MKKLNQSGQVTTEFLFSIIVAFGLFILFLSMSFTFTVVEVGQYIAFSTSRAHAGANKDPASQVDAATKKFQSFQTSTVFGILFKSDWFSFGKNLDIRQGKGTDFRNELGDGGSGANPQFEQVYTGVSIPFQAKVLAIKIPFLNPSSDDSGFQTNINAILIREPTMVECYQYWDQRAQALKTLPSGNSEFYDPSAYVRMEDSGC